MKYNKVAAVFGALSLSAVFPATIRADITSGKNPNILHRLLDPQNFTLIANDGPPIAPADPTSVSVNIFEDVANPSVGGLDLSWSAVRIPLKLPAEIQAQKLSLGSFIKMHMNSLQMVITGQAKANDTKMLANSIGNVRKGFVDDKGRQTLDAAYREECKRLNGILQGVEAVGKDQLPIVISRIVNLTGLGADPRAKNDQKTLAQIVAANPNLANLPNIQAFLDFTERMAYVYDRNEMFARMQSQIGKPQITFEPLNATAVKLLQDAARFDDKTAIPLVLQWIDWGAADAKEAKKLQEQLEQSQEPALANAGKIIGNREIPDWKANNYNALRMFFHLMYEDMTKPAAPAVQLKMEPAQFRFNPRGR